MTLQAKLTRLANDDIHMLIEKGQQYGDSWKKRGGVGAYMMLARKWDRIEKAAENNNYDIFEAMANVDELIDDVIDLGCYLWLVRSEGFTIDDMPSGNPYASIGEEQHPDFNPETAGLVTTEIRKVTLEPVTGIVVDEAVDVWDHMADDHARKKLMRMGDNELIDFLKIGFIKDELVDVNYFSTARITLLINLQMYHQCVMLNERPPRELVDIMDGSSIVISYVDPYRAMGISTDRRAGGL